jgi:hypothetical protein
MSRHAPDLWVALAVWLGTRSESPAVTGWAALLGGLKDACSRDPLGTNAFVLAAVAFTFVRRRGAPPRGASLAGTVFVGALLAHVLYVLRSIPLHRDAPLLSSLPAGFPTAFWTALVAWPLLGLLDRTHALDDLVGRRDGLPA